MITVFYKHPTVSWNFNEFQSWNRSVKGKATSRSECNSFKCRLYILNRHSLLKFNYILHNQRLKKACPWQVRLKGGPDWHGSLDLAWLMSAWHKEFYRFLRFEDSPVRVRKSPLKRVRVISGFRLCYYDMKPGLKTMSNTITCWSYRVYRVTIIERTFIKGVLEGCKKNPHGWKIHFSSSPNRKSFAYEQGEQGGVGGAGVRWFAYNLNNNNNNNNNFNDNFVPTQASFLTQESVGIGRRLQN